MAVEVPLQFPGVCGLRIEIHSTYFTMFSSKSLLLLPLNFLCLGLIIFGWEAVSGQRLRESFWFSSLVLCDYL